MSDVQVIVVGDSASGKTALIRRLTGGSFNKEYNPTKSDEKKRHCIVFEDATRGKFNFTELIPTNMLFDASTSMNGSGLHSQAKVVVDKILKIDFQILMLVYDITNESSFLFIEDLVELMKVKCVAMVVGTRLECEDRRKIPHHKGNVLAQLISALFVEVSLATEKNMDEFMRMLQALHRLSIQLTRPRTLAMSVDGYAKKKPIRTKKISQILSSSDVRAIRNLFNPSSILLMTCFMESLLAVQKYEANRSTLAKEFLKELKGLTTFRDQIYCDINKDTVRVFKYFVSSEISAELLLQLSAIDFLAWQTQADASSLKPVLEIITKLGNYSKLKDKCASQLATCAELFVLLVRTLGIYTDEFKSKQTPVPQYELNLILDTLLLYIHGAELVKVKSLQSWNPLLEILDIYPSWDNIGLRTARIIHVIAQAQSKGISIQFRTDNMLEKLYQLLIDHKMVDLAEDKVVISTSFEPAYSVFAAFVAVLQYNQNHEELAQNENLKKYFTTFVQLSKIEDLHWIIHKPWIGGTKILQQLFTINWHHFSHLLPIIEKHKLILGKTLGAGAFGTVYKGVWKREDGVKKPVAIKVIDTNAKNFDEMELRREFLLLTVLRHPNLVVFYGGCYDTESHCFMIVTELYRGSLNAHIDKLVKSGKSFTRGEQWKLASGIAHGIKYLHQIDVVHRDVKCDNILVNDTLVPHIADFGIARALYDSDKTARGGTWKYMAPEWIESLYQESDYGVNFALQRDCGGDKTFDIFSLGHLFWALWKTEEPLADKNDVQIISAAVKEHKAVLPAIDDAPVAWKKLFEGCWAPQESRFNINQVIDALQLIFSDLSLDGSETLSASENIVWNRVSTQHAALKRERNFTLSATSSPQHLTPSSAHRSVTEDGKLQSLSPRDDATVDPEDIVQSQLEEALMNLEKSKAENARLRRELQNVKSSIAMETARISNAYQNYCDNIYRLVAPKSDFDERASN